jgi:hypothetical protein
MSAIRISRPKQQWKASPATLLPTGLLFRMFKPQSDYTVVLDDQPLGHIGKEQVKVFEAEPGEHQLYVRFVGLRKSDELLVSLKDGEERQFICGSTGMGWPTLREVSPEDVSQIRRTSISEPPKPGDPIAPN